MKTFIEADLVNLVGVPYEQMDCYALVVACVREVHGLQLPALPQACMVWPQRERLLPVVALADVRAGDVVEMCNAHQEPHLGFVLPGLRVLQARRKGKSSVVTWDVVAKFVTCVYRPSASAGVCS